MREPSGCTATPSGNDTPDTGVTIVLLVVLITHTTSAKSSVTYRRLPSGLNATLFGAHPLSQGVSVMVATIALVVVLTTEMVPLFELATYRRACVGWTMRPYGPIALFGSSTIIPISARVSTLTTDTMLSVRPPDT